jgi:AcrR family transcriptional regulator
MVETTTTDGRLLKGAETRAGILRRAVDIASIEGLEALSVRRLAAEMNLSKSGVFAHFGSKEDLQLAVIDEAVQIYLRRVVEPVMTVKPGLSRLNALFDSWLRYAQEPVFPGGCFFLSVAAEFDSRAGRVRDAIAEARRNWLLVYEVTIRDAISNGELDRRVDAGQLAFEIDALAMSAHGTALLNDDEDAYRRARRAVKSRLQAARA